MLACSYFSHQKLFRTTIAPWEPLNYYVFSYVPLAIIIIITLQWTSEFAHMNISGETCGALWGLSFICFRDIYLLVVQLNTEIKMHSISNSSSPSAPYMRQWIGSAFIQIWFVAYSVPSHYLNQCWVIVKWTLRNKLPWISNQNRNIFIKQNASKEIVCEMAAISPGGDQLTGMIITKPARLCLSNKLALKLCWRILSGKILHVFDENSAH